MKRISTVVLALLVTLAGTLPITASAQKKSSTSRQRRTTAKPTPTPAPDMRPEASQIAEQINNVSKFIFVYGKIANGLEIAEEQAKKGQTTPAIQAKYKESKDALIANIRGLRAGLDNLVKVFQANPRLQIQYLKLSYAAEAAANSEKLAAAGNYDDAGKSLVLVVERLTDTIISMRLL